MTRGCAGLLRLFWCQPRTTTTASGTKSSAHQWATLLTVDESAQLRRAPVSSVNMVAKTTQAISRTAAFIVTSRLACMLDRVSASESSDQSHNQPISDSPFIPPRTDIANNRSPHRIDHRT